VFPQIHALQLLAEHCRGASAQPLVEIAEHHFRRSHAAVVHDSREALGLMMPLQQRRAEVHVVEMQRVIAHGDVDALTVARLARLPREVVLEVRADRESAQDHVAEKASAQVSRRRHHPPHTKLRAELFRLAARRRPGADHLLERHDVGIHRADDVGDPGGARAPVEAAAAMDVVSGDAERLAAGFGHLSALE
jgi:hypothetical protein